MTVDEVIDHLLVESDAGHGDYELVVLNRGLKSNIKRVAERSEVDPVPEVILET